MQTNPQWLTVSFATTESLVLEGNSIAIALVLDGPVGASLTQSQGVQLLINGAQSSDYSTLNEVSLPVGMKVGQTKSFLFTATGNDQWVEGPEMVTVALGDAGAIPFGNDSIHAVTIQDADQATVTFTARLNTAPATAVLALGVGIPKGVVQEPSTHQIYALMDGGCEETCAGLFRAYSGSGPVKVGAALNLKDAANMALTPHGNFLILAGGAGCALEYGRIIEYNPVEDQLVREYYIDNDTQIRKWGGVTVLRNHVNWTP